MSLKILGISCYYHDAAAALLVGGDVVAAAQEERFTRKKHDPEFPQHAIDYCLAEGRISVRDLDAVAFYDKPLLKFERILTAAVDTWPRSYRAFMKAVPVWLKQKLWIESLIRKSLAFDGPLYFLEHHLSHAASSFFASPFKEAAILTLDGVGEWATASMGVGHGKSIELLREIHFPHSIGLLYSAFTYHLGFKVNSAEYKVMGLAPYGKPVYYDTLLSELIDLKEDGSFRLNMKYFSFDYGLEMCGKPFARLFGIERRKPESDVLPEHADLAASVQKVTEEVMLRMAASLHDQTRLENLCLAGGVALNCVADGRLAREGPYRSIFIQPAAGDAGGAVGAAYFVHHLLDGRERVVKEWDHAFFGPSYDMEVEQLLLAEGVPYERLEDHELAERAADLLADQKVIGWYQGRLEFGPRALGNRSILADPRNCENKDIVNAKIKFRESFRPFAPTVLEEETKKYFDLDRKSPFMLFTAPVKTKDLPAITHVDGSARIQTIDRISNPRYYHVVEAFRRKTGCGVLLNTSFNLRGEPLVNTPREAYVCFRRSGLDFLIMGNCLVDKSKVGSYEETQSWRDELVLD